jgi:hypothetical protein
MSRKKREVRKIVNELKRIDKKAKFPKLGSLVDVVTDRGINYTCMYIGNKLFQPLCKPYSLSHNEITNWKYFLTPAIKSEEFVPDGL